MSGPKIVFWYKNFCPWSNGVRSLLKEQGLDFDEREVTKNPCHYEEMKEKTGQSAAPCLDIDGHLLIDVGREEVESYLKKKGFFKG